MTRAEDMANEPVLTLNDAKLAVDLMRMEVDDLLRHGLVVINELIRRERISMVVETPECTYGCSLTSANFNGPFIDLWMDEKFGKEIKPE